MSLSSFNKTQLLLGSLMVFGSTGCGTNKKSDSKTDQELKSTREELAQNVKKYNELVDDYNSLTVVSGVIADGYLKTNEAKTLRDEFIKKAATQLNTFDLYVGYLTGFLTISDSAIDLKDCSSAKAEMDHARKHLDKVLTSANELSQGGLSQAIDALIEEEKKKTDSDSIDTLKILDSNLKKGLNGAKGLSLFAFNQTVDSYNQVCATKIAPGATTSSPVPATTPGRVVSVSGTGTPESLTPTEMTTRYAGTYDGAAYSSFSALAEGSGGILGFSPRPELFSSTVEAILSEIEKVPGTVKDIAIVLDTTSSMADDIENVKINMAKIIENLKKSGKSIRLALVQFRDVGDEYVTRVESDFTNDLDKINQSIQAARVNGGGDEPEAVIDALEVSMDKLSWSNGASKSVILIGDAPPQPKSASGKTQEQIISDFKAAGLGIVIYPILLSK